MTARMAPRMNPLFDLSGKVAIVTGSTRGIGLACGLTWLTVCEEVWVQDADGVSAGMLVLIEEARRLGLPVLYPWRREEARREPER